MWLEQWLVLDAPARVLRTLRRLAGRTHSVVPEAVVARIQRRQERVSDLLDTKLFARLYQFVRPRGLWRIIRRQVLPQLDLDHTRQIVVSGASGVTTAWRLAKRYPNLTVTTSTVPPGSEG